MTELIIPETYKGFRIIPRDDNYVVIQSEGTEQLKCERERAHGIIDMNNHIERRSIRALIRSATASGRLTLESIFAGFGPL